MPQSSSPQAGPNVHNINDEELTASLFLLDGPKTSDNAPGLTFSYPPDNGLGASDKYVVSVENSVIEWTTVAGGGKSEMPMADFLKPLGAFKNMGDSRATYDAASGRFIVSGTSTDSSNNHHYTVAISKDANPNDGWTYQSFDPPHPTDYPDQPSVVTDGSNIYLASLLPANQQEVLVANGGPSSFNGTGAYIRINLGTDNAVYRQNAGVGRGDLLFARQGRTMTIKHIDTTSRSIDATSTVDLGASVSAAQPGHSLLTLGTSRKINAGSMQVTGNAYSNGFLYVTFEDVPQSGPDAGVSNTHWAKLDVHDPSHAALIAQGNISGAQIGSGIGTFNSSIAVDGAGDVLVNFTATGPSLVPTDYYVVQYAGTSDGSFSKPVEYKASAGPFTDPAASASAGQTTRWGDYSSAVPDPANPHAFWISNEYGISPGTNQWGTATAHVIANPMPPANGGALQFVDQTTAASGTVAMDLPTAGGPNYLQGQYIYGGSDNMLFSTQAPNAFIHSGAGDDAIQVTSGQNVLDGGLGSNFLTGGTGTDTFFTDARSPGAVWNTIQNFHVGDAVTLWGFTSGISSYHWDASAGAAGSQGATLEADIVGGNGRTGNGVDASITFAGISISQAEHLQIAAGSQSGGDYLSVSNHWV